VYKRQIVGRTYSIEELINDYGFDSVFIGSGAGLPRFMKIDGEELIGVFSANEYLTRINLMKAYQTNSMTPLLKGNKVVVVGGGNVAMDAARSALRMGSEVHIVYRRSLNELPARKEEVHHAQEEGIIFDTLCNPTKIIGDGGKVIGINCLRMVLGEPDASGRRRPVPISDSQFTLAADLVIMAIGTNPNPLIVSTTEGLDSQSWGGIKVDEATMQTNIEGVYSGGDAVTGAATVILAMGAGKKAAKAMIDFMHKK
jgi:glutamate synthase (NADPH/NADH) small chain